MFSFRSGLEIPLLLKFSCSQQKPFEKMKTFIQTLYDYNFTGTAKEEDSSDEEDETVTISMADDSQPDDQLKQLVSYTDSESTSSDEDERPTLEEVDSDNPIEIVID